MDLVIAPLDKNYNVGYLVYLWPFLSKQKALPIPYMIAFKPAPIGVQGGHSIILSRNHYQVGYNYHDDTANSAHCISNGCGIRRVRINWSGGLPE